MSREGRMAGPGSRPPWYVFVLAALGVLLVLTAIIGIGPRATTLFPFTEPVPQPYRGPGVPAPASSLGDPTSVTTTSPNHRAVAAPPAAGAPAIGAPAIGAPATGASTAGSPTVGGTGTASTTAPVATVPSATTTPGRSTVTIVLPDPGSGGGYCCQYSGGGGRGGGGGGYHH